MGRELEDGRDAYKSSRAGKKAKKQEREREEKCLVVDQSCICSLCNREHMRNVLTGCTVQWQGSWRGTGRGHWRHCGVAGWAEGWNVIADKLGKRLIILIGW